MPRRPSPRAARPRLDACEPRLLLSGDPTALWVGQDGVDLAGPTARLGPSDVQDIHIGLANLPAGKAVAGISVYPYGGGDWEVNGTNGSWAGAFVAAPGASTGELYVEPYTVETGRKIDIVLHYGDGTSYGFSFAGGTADPNLRMPAAALSAAWAGQDGADFVGRGPGVGPDGFKDVHIVLSNLSANVDITDAVVKSAGGETWRFGNNHPGDNNAELIRRPADPTKADLYIQPGVDLGGGNLAVSLSYANGKTDAATVAASAVDPTGRVSTPGPLPTLAIAPTARWLGQDGTDGPGNVHLALDGLSAGKKVVGVTLTDAAGGAWTYRAAGSSTYVDPSAASMSFHPTAGSSHADLSFAPTRDEAGSTLSLLVRYDDGSLGVTTLAGGMSDLGKLSAGIAPTSVVAHPGDDLGDLAGRFGTVRLSAGTYNLSAPLVLNRPVTLAADPGVTLRFAQAADATTWAAAIKINAGHTTLDGFAVRFAGPVRWTPDVSYGPAVIGTSDNTDGYQPDPKIAVNVRNLDLQSPPVLAGIEEAPRLLRLVTARSGEVSGNTLKGGITEFAGGPWRIVGNTYDGTVPHTVAYGAFAGHGTHDLVITDNHVEPIGASGKTYRFLVLTGSGVGDVIARNTVVGIGPMDTDTGPNANAPETILTESYSLDFEGSPAAISADRTILQVPSLQGATPQAGDVVAIVGGAAAGVYARIAQVIDKYTYLLASPLPAGADVVSIARGFIGEIFSGNTIDNRGSTTSVGLDLLGNHFGTTVAGNHFLGGGSAFRITAAPTEHPGSFGWSHAPALGLTIAGNTLDDVAGGAVVAVEHADAIKSNKGRTYLTASIVDTTVRWSAAYLAARPKPVALTIGDPGSLDPAELVASTANNRVQGPPGLSFADTLVIHAGKIDGQLVLEQTRSLPNVAPAAPAPILLASSDSGVSHVDHLTNVRSPEFSATADATDRLSLVRNGVEVAARVGPGSLVDGAVHVDGLYTYKLRRTDLAGNVSTSLPTVLLQDTTPPTAVQGLAQAADGRVSFRSTGKTDVYEYRLNGTGAYTPIGSATTFAPVITGAGFIALSVRATDLAGNAGPEATIAAIRPSKFAGAWLGQDGSDFAGSATGGPDGIQDIHIALTGLDPDHAIARVEVRPYGGGIWVYPGQTGTGGAAVVRAAGSTTAELYLPPYQVDAGRNYWVTVTYTSGITDGFDVHGGAVDPTKKVNSPPPAGGGAPASLAAGQVSTPTARKAQARVVAAQVKITAAKARVAAATTQHAVVKHGAGWGKAARSIKAVRHK